MVTMRSSISFSLLTLVTMFINVNAAPTTLEARLQPPRGPCYNIGSPTPGLGFLSLVPSGSVSLNPSLGPNLKFTGTSITTASKGAIFYIDATTKLVRLGSTSAAPYVVSAADGLVYQAPLGNSNPQNILTANIGSDGKGTLTTTLNGKPNFGTVGATYCTAKQNLYLNPPKSVPETGCPDVGKFIFTSVPCS